MHVRSERSAQKKVRAFYWELVLFLLSIESFHFIPENESEQPVLGWNTSNAHSHSPPLNLRAVIPAIYFSILWWKPSSNVIFASITNQISLPYRSTTCTTTLGINPQALIGAMYSPSPFLPFPISSESYSSCFTTPLSHYYCTSPSLQGRGMRLLPR